MRNITIGLIRYNGANTTWDLQYIRVDASEITATQITLRLKMAVAAGEVATGAVSLALQL